MSSSLHVRAIAGIPVRGSTLLRVSIVITPPIRYLRKTHECAKLNNEAQKHRAVVGGRSPPTELAEKALKVPIHAKRNRRAQMQVAL